MALIGQDGHKRCSKCKTVKDRAAFGVSRACTDGLTCWCKSCKNAKGKERYHSGDGSREHKLKQASERRANDPGVREERAVKNAAWYAERKATDPAFMQTRQKRDQVWRKRHPESVKAKAQKQWEHISSSPERLAKNNKRQREYGRNRYANDPEYRQWHRDYYARRRATKRSNGGTYELEDWQTMCMLADNRCVACGKKRKLTVDHVLPIIMGGDSYLTNLQPLCDSCNKSKGPKHIDYRPARIHQWLDVLTD
ncbi:hypothetical protein LCGC14_0500500 [marine sediment metagenome]|uniref:HNH nuclease domain-containing protein n=1 Tax=marine sediment metagenome TaxID=412755 RepID=A0A0F9UR20_9ZZZZ